VVLGSAYPEAIRLVAETYRPILEQTFPGGDRQRRPALVRTTPSTAEAIKYASNAFLAMKISFMNEIANICDGIGADIAEVATAVGLDHRIGPDFLEAGVGWGGSCFGKDLAGLIVAARRRNVGRGSRHDDRAVLEAECATGTGVGRRVGLRICITRCLTSPCRPGRSKRALRCVAS
jgi:nucleotide sugar dehydrogenase